MSAFAAFSTIMGAFLLVFGLRVLWDRMVYKWGAIGGYLAAISIVGTIWILDHGINHPLIHQSGTVWVDMSLAAGIGAYVATAVAGGNIKKSLPNVASAVVGGILAAFLLKFTS